MKHKAHRILLGQLGSNGDCLYATTLARQIKADHPGSILTWAISSKCRHLLLHNPHVDEVWEMPLDSWDDYANCWNRFETEAKARLALGEYDRFIPSQIYPGNLDNYDGTIRPSIFRAYGGPVTVPLRSILRLTDMEMKTAENFVRHNDLLDGRPVVLFECASKSGQSFVTPEWALNVAKLVRKRLPDVKFILSSHLRIESGDPGIIDGSRLSMRETAGLLPHCAAFSGCGSGITVMASTLEQSPPDMPLVQFLARDSSVYASLSEDFRHFGLDDGRFIESCDDDVGKAADLMITLMNSGLECARAAYHRPAPLDFSYYLTLMRSAALESATPWTTAPSLRLLAGRFGWDDVLRRYAVQEVLPRLIGAAEKGDARSGLAVAELKQTLNEGADRDAAPAGKFVIKSIDGRPLRREFQIAPDRLGDLSVWQRTATASRKALEAKIVGQNTRCSPERRGTAIGEAAFEGEWRSLPRATAAPYDDFESEIACLEPHGRHGKTTAAGYENLAGKVWRRFRDSLPSSGYGALNLMRRLPGGMLKYFLRRLGIGEYASRKWRKFREEYLGIRRPKTGKASLPAAIGAVADGVARLQFLGDHIHDLRRILVTDDLDVYPGGFPYSGIVCRQPGYGFRPYATKYVLQAAPHFLRALARPPRRVPISGKWRVHLR